MKPLFQFGLACIVLILLALSSCSAPAEEEQVHYLPFRETADGKWGMMATDGKVLFSAKFANAPTVVYDDRFFVYNDKGLLEMYTAEAEPRKIGGEYLTAGHFHKGRALVAEPGQAVKIIDTDGNTVRLLDKIQNKIISKVSTFEHGYALFQTVDYLCGAVDLDGNSVISPNYAMLVAGNGIFLAVPSQYSQAVEQGDLKTVTFCVLDTDEKVLAQIPARNYNDIQLLGDKILLSEEVNHRLLWSVLDKTGQRLFKGDDRIERIGELRGENFTFLSNELWGVMNFKGEILIRPQYNELRFDGDQQLIATVDKDADYTQDQLIDLRNQPLGTANYAVIYPFSDFDGEHTLVQKHDNTFALIDRKGQVLNNLPNMVEVEMNSGDDNIESNAIAFAMLIDGFGIRTGGVDGLEVGNTGISVIQKVGYKRLVGRADSLTPASDPSWYHSSQELVYKKRFAGVEGHVTLLFDRMISRAEKDGSGTKYVWNDAKLKVCALTFYNTGKMEDNLSDFFNVLSEEFGQKGKPLRKNKQYTIFDMGNGQRIMLDLNPQRLFILWTTGAIIDHLDFKEIVSSVSSENSAAGRNTSPTAETEEEQDPTIPYNH